jgi:hypothetical protein
LSEDRVALLDKHAFDWEYDGREDDVRGGDGREAGADVEQGGVEVGEAGSSSRAGEGGGGGGGGGGGTPVTPSELKGQSSSSNTGAQPSSRASRGVGSESVPASPRRTSPKAPRREGKVTPKKGSLGGAPSERELSVLQEVYERGEGGVASAVAYADALLRSGDLSRAEEVCAVSLAVEGDKGKGHIRSIFR